jgi:hypothetical protein
MIGISLDLNAKTRTAAQRTLSRVIADAPSQLYLASRGIAPANAADTDPITGWSNVIGSSYPHVFAAGHRPQFQSGAGKPYVECTRALDVVSSVAGSLALSTRTIRWTMNCASATGAGAQGEILFLGGDFFIAIHAGANYINAGNKILCYFGVGGSTMNSTTMLAGLHDYEVRFDFTTRTSTVYVDGVAQAPFAHSNAAAVTVPVALGYATANAQDVNLYGYAVQNSYGTDAQMANWIAMSKANFGSR